MDVSGDSYFIRDQNKIYFLTLTVVDWLDVFTRKEYKIIIAESLNYCIKNKGMIIYAYVIMSNHLHIITKAEEGYRLSDILRDFKKHTSKQIVLKMLEIDESRRDWMLSKFSFHARRTRRAKNYKLWRDDNHAICLEQRDWYLTRLNYVHQNPVKQMIVERGEDYLFSSAMDYAGKKGLVQITIG